MKTAMHVTDARVTCENGTVVIHLKDIVFERCVFTGFGSVEIVAAVLQDAPVFLQRDEA